MEPIWKSGGLVRIGSEGVRLSVVGYDSVGSVICELADREVPRERLYVTPALLYNAESERDTHN